MEPGDRVKVVRLDEYTLDVYRANGQPTPIGTVGTVEEVYYNKNMRRMEVVVRAEGCSWIYEPWNLMIVERHG